jgi:hypothetical protein
MLIFINSVPYLWLDGTRMEQKQQMMQVEIE